MNEQEQQHQNNSCLDMGQLASLRDNELSAEQQATARAHIEHCQDCAADYRGMNAGTDEIYGLLSGLDTGSQGQVNTAKAFASVQSKLDTIAPPAADEEHPELVPLKRTAQPTRASMRTRHYTWPVAAAAAIVLAVLLIPNASALANQFLALFRVQQFQPVTIDPRNLSDQVFNDFQNFSDVQYNTNNNTDLPQDPTQAQVRQFIHFPLALPGHTPQGVGSQVHYDLIPGANATFTFNLAKARAYLNHTGQSSVKIPSQLDGATFTVKTQPGVVLNYTNSCKDIKTHIGPKAILNNGQQPKTVVACSGGTPFYVVEIPSPVIQATGKASLQDLRDFALSEPKLSADVRAILEKLDLQKGIVPLPLPSQVQAQQVTINGAKGVLLADDSIKAGAALWQSNGIIYMTATTASGSEILDIANSLH